MPDSVYGFVSCPKCGGRGEIDPPEPDSSWLDGLLKALGVRASKTRDSEKAAPARVPCDKCNGKGEIEWPPVR
jgi:RecJ-like exonuclease